MLSLRTLYSVRFLTTYKQINMKILFKEFPGMEYLIKEKEFNCCTKSEFIRFLKLKYKSLPQLKNRFIKQDITYLQDFFLFVEEYFDKSTAFSYQEAFELKNDTFKSVVFGCINIAEMISYLGSSKIKVDGINVKRKKFNKEGGYIGTEENDSIFETYKVSGDKLGINNPVYVLKCWCTTTNKEHWIWIDEKYKDDPLSAVASTFIIHENIIPFIKEIKRQGDVLLCEFNSIVEKDKFIGNKRSLTKQEYFKFLSSES